MKFLQLNLPVTKVYLSTLVFIHSLVFKEKIVSFVCMSGVCVWYTYMHVGSKRSQERALTTDAENQTLVLCKSAMFLINTEPALQSPLVLTLCYSFKCRHFLHECCSVSLGVFFRLRCFCNVFLKIQIFNHC